MLDQIARHGMVGLDIACKGDLEIDAHHTVEDVGIVLGEAFALAPGDKKVSRATDTLMCRLTKRYSRRHRFLRRQACSIALTTRAPNGT